MRHDAARRRPAAGGKARRYAALFGGATARPRARRQLARRPGRNRIAPRGRARRAGVRRQWRGRCRATAQVVRPGGCRATRERPVCLDRFGATRRATTSVAAVAGEHHLGWRGEPAARALRQVARAGRCRSTRELRVSREGMHDFLVDGRDGRFAARCSRRDHRAFRRAGNVRRDLRRRQTCR